MLAIYENNQIIAKYLIENKADIKWKNGEAALLLPETALWSCYETMLYTDFSKQSQLCMSSWYFTVADRSMSEC